LPDRVLHWIMACCVLTLMGTALLPILGIKFSWVTAHWITGLVLTAAVFMHLLRSLHWSRLKQMLLGPRDLRDALATLAWFIRFRHSAPRPGKYSPAQKFIHLAFAGLILAAIVTGLLMMVKIDTPLWQRDPYLFSAATWGVIYLIHGAAAVILITVIMLHVYFALRPEKRCYLRAMIQGWISREMFEKNHDPDRWEFK
jgi:cytochrome b subunit of formate dehydrogenase